jgi:predicted metalloprotease with PDZ domain
LPAAPVLADEQAAVQHRLSFPERRNQYVHVSATFPASGASLELAMASWTPGSYLIRDFAANVEGLRAADSAGNALPALKTAKNRWRIDTGGAAEVTVDYDVWAGELNVSESWVEAEIALINGAGVFLYNQDSRDRPQRVTVTLPPDWSRVSAALESDATGLFLARDFDELVDSPIVAGNTVHLDFWVEDQVYSLILSGENPFWDDKKSRDDVQKLVLAHQAFWRENPFERKYLFFNFFMGPYGGLEHDHSTVMMCSPWQMRSQGDYTKWLSLVSHEFFHAWNVRRLRPAALIEYDYEREMYSRELWLAEGLTSYYDTLLLFRSGLIDVGDYFELLAKEIRDYETVPGREVRSAELASFDTWVKHYQPDGNSVNSTVSYYRKGALIGFVTDFAIRRATRNGRSLDDVMREMYRRYGPEGEEGIGYPPGAFEDVVESMAGAEVRAVVEDMLRTTGDPAVDEALEWYGLSLNRSPGRELAEAAGAPIPTGFGVSWDTSEGHLLVEEVVRGSTGADAGLLPGDELVAIGDFRVTPATYAARVQRLEPGESIELLVTRHERLLRLPATVQHAIPESFQVVPKPRLSKREKQRLEAWLGRELIFKR